MRLSCGVGSPLDSREFKSVNPKGNQSWIVFGRTDAEAETPILWPPNEKSWLIAKDSDAEKDRRQEEKGTTEDKIIVKLESKFLLAEPKNELHEYSNTYISKQIGFIKEKESTKPSA